MCANSVGQMRYTSAAQEGTIRKGAENWRLRDTEEKQARRERAKRGKRVVSRNGPVVTTVRVRPDVLRVALKLANYDASRIQIISDTEVVVR